MDYRYRLKSPLYKLRMALGGISLTDLARNLNLSITMIYNIEHGKVKKLPNKFIKKLETVNFPKKNEFISEYENFINSLGKSKINIIEWDKLNDNFLESY